MERTLREQRVHWWFLNLTHVSDAVQVVDVRTTLTLTYTSACGVQEVRLVVSQDAQNYLTVTEFRVSKTVENGEGSYHLTLEDGEDSYQFSRESSQESKEESISNTQCTQSSSHPEKTRKDELSTSIHVICANIWNFNHWEARIELLQDEFIETLPDIIGFQEVRSIKSSATKTSTSSEELLAPRPGPPHRHQVQDLAKILPGFQYVFEPAMMFEQGGELHQEGLAIFSRYPIVQTEYLKLSRETSDHEDFHQRIVLRALLSTPLGLINCFNTHLSLSVQARRRTMAEIGEYVSSFKEPGILLGDFNSVVAEEQGQWIKKFNLVDTWQISKVEGGDDANEGFTFSSWDPRSRIDYIFAKDLTTRNVSIVGKRSIPSDLPAIAGVKDMKGRLHPSDHLFLAATMEAMASS